MPACLALAGALAGCDSFTEPAGMVGQGAVGGAGGAGGAPVGLEVALPQAVAGALHVNPDAYDAVPLHVATSPEATAVSVRLAEQQIVASGDGPGAWTALLPVAGLGDGIVALSATAEAPGESPVSVAAELGVSRTGVPLTAFDVDGFAGTPRLHWRDGSLWVTFTDRHEGAAEAWLRQLDGAGRWLGEPMALVGSDDETVYARTAFGHESVGVLYQQLGEPYVTYFKIVGFDGVEELAAMPLDPHGDAGTFGGDIAFDGEAYVMTWRTVGASRAHLRWLRVVEATGESTGPIVVARSGPGTEADPTGTFPPFSFVSIQPVGPGSLVSFVRERYHSLVDSLIPKGQLALVGDDGTVLYTRYAGIENDLTWHREARVFPLGGAVMALWSATDLTSPADWPPTWFYATRTDGDGGLDPLRGKGEIVVDAVDDRDEPFFLEHPTEHGVLAWLDHRAYSLDPPNGRVELYVATVDESLRAGEPTAFGHARVFVGLAQLRATLAGTNALLVWLDKRHSSGLDGIQELWFDTAWF